MAELVKEPFQFGKRGRQLRINWNEIADGRTYRLNPNEDFPGDASTGTVQSSAHQAAARRGMKARTTVDGSSVIVQFYTDQPEVDSAVSDLPSP